MIKGKRSEEVLHVPELRANLQSLIQLVDDTGWRFILDSDSFFLCLKGTGQRISLVSRTAGLLLLDGLGEDGEQKVAYAAQSKERITLLHRRLEHPSFHTLK